MYQVGRTVFHAIHNYEQCMVHTPLLRGVSVEYGSILQHRLLALCAYEDTFISTLSQEINIEESKTSGQ